METHSLSTTQLRDIARQVRRDIIAMIAAAGSGHPGGSLSATEIVTALYCSVMRHNPHQPDWPDRDRFILSKGHAALVLYAVLGQLGYFPVEELTTLRKLGSRLQGHTDRTLTPGVEMSAGSLGMGLSFGLGVALAARLDCRSYRTYVLLGDGECDEGEVWEAAMAAAHYRMDNLVAIVDHNKLQLCGWNKDVMNLQPLAQKWQAFGWNVLEIDGHNFDEIIHACGAASRARGQPTAIVAHTIKGKGVSFMENNVEFHGKAPTADEARLALEELK